MIYYHRGRQIVHVAQRVTLIRYVHDSFKVTKTKPLNLYLTWKGQIMKINEGGLQKNY